MSDAADRDGMPGFDWQPRTRMVFGPGTLNRLGELARDLPATRMLIVTDPGIAAAGHLSRACRALEAVGIETVVFEGVHENPTTRDVGACVAVARRERIDGLVGLGGGSSLDTAKGCNFLLTNGGRMQDYWGSGKATRPMLPLIAIPTTAGTGSECQSYALIADAETHQKMACGDPKAAARIALLDPELTVSQPRRVTICTGIDAIAHAVETAVTRKRTPFSLLSAREAFRLTLGNFARVLEAPEDLEARAAMQLGAAYAGIAIETSMLGAAHSAANPLTAHFNVVHGLAVGLMLPHVVRFNGSNPTAALGYRDLAAAGGLVAVDVAPADAVETLARRLHGLLTLAGLPVSIAAAGVPDRAIPELAAEAARQWTATFNPRCASASDFETLYAEAFVPTRDCE